MIRALLLIIAFCCLGTSAFSQAADVRFNRLNREDGFAGGSVNCLFQDSRGFMWLGTEDSLSRYDGYSFQTFPYGTTDSSAVRGNLIQALSEDSLGNLWIGTQYGLSRLDRFTQKVTVYGNNQKGLLSSDIRDLTGAPDNRMWIGTDRGLFQWVSEADSFLRFPLPQGEAASILSLNPGGDSCLWIGLERQRSVVRLDLRDGSTQSFGLSRASIVNQILTNRQGTLYIGTNSGVLELTPGGEGFVSLQAKGAASLLLSRSNVEAISEDLQGRLWFGSDDGLFQYDPATRNLIRYRSNPRSPNDQTYLSDSSILSLLVDRSGLLWIGTYGGGVNTLNLIGVKFGKIQRNEGGATPLLSDEVYAIMEDREGTIWFGTDKGISLMGASDALHSYLLHDPDDPASLGDDPVYCLTQDRKGDIWVGTGGGGLYWLEADRLASGHFLFRHFDTDPGKEPSLSSNEITCLFEDRDSTLWVGTTGGVNALSPDRKALRTFGIDNDLDNEEIQCIYRDHAGELWIGTYQGLYHFDEESERFSLLKLKSEAQRVLGEGTIYTLHEDRTGYLFLGTNLGLCRLSPDRKSSELYSTEDGLPDNFVYNLLEDEEQNLWLSTNQGLAKVKFQDNSRDLAIINYSSKKGQLHCDAFNYGAHCKTRSGYMLFGCDRGAVWFQPANIKENEYVPPVVLTDFQLSYRPVSLNDPDSPLKAPISETRKLVLAPTQNALSFEFAALNFIEPEKNEYRFMMENLDDGWRRPFKGSRRVDYPSVSPGHYTFRVQASNNEGLWNETGVVLDIVIKPPFTQTPLFYFLCLLALIALVIAYVRIRTRNLEQNKKRLEETVAQRTEEVQRKNQELEVTLENLKAAQTQLVEQEKMASLGQLTAGVAHEINNPITFVSGNVSPLKRDLADLMSILNKYDELVKISDINGQFDEIEQLKKTMDYDFLVEEIDDLLNGIQEGADRTSEIVKGLRNFSRLDEDDLKLANVNEGIESTLLILRSEFKTRIEVIKDYQDMPDILCYPGKLNGVYMNILTNAIQAIQGEGKIFITTRYHDKKVYITIRDTGEGMPESVKKRIFEPFFTTKDVGFGTGLGLSISYGTIEQHKGKITVESAPGKGTEFKIVIPGETE